MNKAELIENIHSKRTKRDCLSFFQDLEKKKSNKANNVICYDNKCLKQKTFSYERYLDIFILGNTMLYGKRFNEQSIYSMASSKMLNKLSHPTPPIIIIEDAGNYLRTATENILPLEDQDYEIIPAFKCIELQKLNELHTQDKENKRHLKYGKWAPLYFEEEKQAFLSFMTEDCFNEFILHFLTAELRTDSDRHQGNYYLVRKKGSKKYESFIQIDLERSEIINAMCYSKYKFNQFIKSHNYYSIDMYSRIENKLTYTERVKQLKQLVQNNNLNSLQILQLKEILNYNLPKEIQKLRKHHKGNIEIEKIADMTYDKVSQLWEYNQKEIGYEINI